MNKPSAVLLSAIAFLGPTPAAFAKVPDSMPRAMMEEASPKADTRLLMKHTTANGTTKALGSALDERRGTKPFLDAESRRIDRLVHSSVCTGC